MILKFFILKKNLNLKGDIGAMKCFLVIKIFFNRVLGYFVKECFLNDIPRQYLCGRRKQDIAYIGSNFFERTNKKGE